MPGTDESQSEFSRGIDPCANAAPRFTILSVSRSEDVKKEKILDQGGYRYYIKRMSYVNLEKKKIFSMIWLDANSPESLAEKVAEPNDTSDWQFYFTEEPSRYVRDLLTSELDVIHARRAAS